jgi:uncharacterized membrane protein
MATSVTIARHGGVVTAAAPSEQKSIDRGAAALLWCAALLAALVPILAAAAPALDARLGGEATRIRSLFGPLCHQIVERSFASAAGPHALCARCEGLYLGGALALALAAASRQLRLKKPQRWLWLALAPTALDLAVRFAGGAGLDSPARFATALLAGFAAGALLVIGLLDVSLWWTQRSSRSAARIAPRGGTLAENENG